MDNMRASKQKGIAIIGSGSMFLLICLSVAFFACVPGCDEQPDVTGPVIVQVPVPPDAAQAIIKLGSSPSQIVTIGDEYVAELPISLPEFEFGQNNRLLVEFKDRQGESLKNWEVSEEVYVSSSGRTDIKLQLIHFSEPYIGASVAESLLGTTITIEGWNFAADEDVSMELTTENIIPDMSENLSVGTNWSGIRLQSGTEYQDKAPNQAQNVINELFRARADVSGHFLATHALSANTIIGALEQETFIRAIGEESGRKAELLFTGMFTEPYIYVSPDEASSGTEINVKGWNFGENEFIEIFSGDALLSSVSTNASGSFDAAFRVLAEAQVGKTSIWVKGLESDNEKEIPFAITTRSVEIAPPAGAVGNEIKVEGSNFSPGENISIDFAGIEGVASVKADENGSFGVDFTVPETDPGKTSIWLRGLESDYKEQFPFTVPISSIFVNPTAGAIGAVITVTGLNFAANEDITIDFGDVEGIASAVTDEDGSLEMEFEVPEDMLPGRTSIRATGLTSGYSEEVEFVIPVHNLYVDPATGVMGAEITVRGSGFSGSEYIQIDFGDMESTASAEADENGSFERAFMVPKYDPGVTLIRATGLTSGYREEIPFTVPFPSMSVNPATGAVGTQIILTGSSFGANEDIQIDFDDKEVAETRTDLSGNFETEIEVPKAAPGERLVWVEGLSSGYRTQFEFRINDPHVDISPLAGASGAEITVKGSNFGAVEDIRIDLMDNDLIVIAEDIARAKADASGGFEVAFTVPESAPIGQAFIQVKGQNSGFLVHLAFTVSIGLINVNPDSDVIGNELIVTGTGFRAYEDISIDFGDMKGTANAKADMLGSFVVTFPIPRSDPGEKLIQANGMESGYQQEASFKIPSYFTEVVPPAGVSGVKVTVKGWNFGAREDIQIDLGQIDPDDKGFIVIAKDIARAKANASGGFEVTFTVPESAPPGQAFIQVKGQNSEFTAIPEFTITRLVISVAPDSGVIGSGVTATGTGFRAYEDISIDFGDMKGIANAKADMLGSFVVTFPIPRSDPGEKLIQANGMESGYQQEASFKIPSYFTEVVPPAGVSGVTVTVKGWNFGAREDIQIDFDGMRIDEAGAKTDTLGNFETEFEVPKSDPGEKLIRIRGMLSSYEERFPFNIPGHFIEVEPIKGVRGSVVTVKGKNFGAEEKIQIYLMNEAFEKIARVADQIADTLGSFEANFIVPPNAPIGQNHVQAIGLESEFSANSTYQVLAAEPSIVVQCPSDEFEKGAEFTVQIVVQDVTDLFEASFSLEYDPSLLEITDAFAGDFFGVDPEFTATPGEDAGGLNISTKAGSPKGITGTGVLATIQFRAIQVGTGTISINTQKDKLSLTTPDGKPIPNSDKLAATPCTFIISLKQIVFGIDPLESHVILEEEIKLKAVISNVDDLFGASFEIQYDGDILGYVSAEAGDFMGEDILFFAFPEEDSISIAVTMRAGMPPVSGSGTVASITFRGKSKGSSQVSFRQDNLVITKSDGTPILPALVNGAVIVDLETSLEPAKRQIER